MSRDDEIERLRRLRDRQISLRDPGQKQEKVQHQVARKRRASREPFRFSRIFTDLPKVITGTLLGLLIGILIVIVLPYFVHTEWVNIAGIGAAVILTFFGAAFGQAIDARDRLRDV
jgi:F0F1-type ATP synthase assembly protein I